MLAAQLRRERSDDHVDDDVLLLVMTISGLGNGEMTAAHAPGDTAMTTRYLNPDGLHRSPAFSQAVVVEQPAKTIYIGGQNGVDAEGQLVGTSVGEQTRQALRNLATVLASEGASLADIVHWRVAVVEGNAFDEGFAAFQQVWDPADPPPAITVHVVAGLGPGRLVEIDAVAAV